jgi:hypothetical protein
VGCGERARRVALIVEVMRRVWKGWWGGCNMVETTAWTWKWQGLWFDKGLGSHMELRSGMQEGPCLHRVQSRLWMGVGMVPEGKRGALGPLVWCHLQQEEAGARMVVISLVLPFLLQSILLSVAVWLLEKEHAPQLSLLPSLHLSMLLW